MKVIVSHKKDFTHYGGLIPIVNEMVKRGLPDLIDSSFPDVQNAKQCKYKLSDMFMSMIAASLCGGKRIYNIETLKPDLEMIPGLNVPSHDTMGRLMKKLISPATIKDRNTNDTSRTNYLDENLPLNELLIKASKLMGALKEGEEYILDVDCTFINTRTFGAETMRGINQYGFYPMICLIGNLPVFVSMRNGNSNADFHEKETIQACIELLQAEGITVKKVRTDNAGYRAPIFEMLTERGVGFISAGAVNNSWKRMWRGLADYNWKDIEIRGSSFVTPCEYSETTYNMDESDLDVRVVALRTKADAIATSEESERRELIKVKMQKHYDDGLLNNPPKSPPGENWKLRNGYYYRMYVTSDFEMSAEDVVNELNQRGDGERKFSFMKNDFGWKYPPFTWMQENTVFMIIMALANNVFRAMAELFNEHVDELELNARVDRFRKLFVQTYCEIRRNGRLIRFKGTNIDFSKIC